MAIRFSPCAERRAKVYSRLREMCLDHQFWPKQQLQVEDLANHLSSSTTPVREALARLAGEGLINCIPNRGYFAQYISEEETRQQIEIMFLLLRHALKCKKSSANLLPRSVIPAISPDGPCTLSLVNRVYTAVVAMSCNQTLISKVARMLEATGFVRSVDLEMPLHASRSCISLAGLKANIEADDLVAADENLDQHYLELDERLHLAIREARLRAGCVRIPPGPSSAFGQGRS